MNRWLSQTRITAASTSARIGRYCASRSRRGTKVRTDMWSVLAGRELMTGRDVSPLPDDNLRCTPDRKIVAQVSPLPRPAAVGIEDDVNVFAGVGRQVDHQGDPLA